MKLETKNYTIIVNDDGTHTAAVKNSLVPLHTPGNLLITRSGFIYNNYIGTLLNYGRVRLKDSENAALIQAFHTCSKLTALDYANRPMTFENVGDNVNKWEGSNYRIYFDLMLRMYRDESGMRLGIGRSLKHWYKTIAHLTHIDDIPISTLLHHSSIPSINLTAIL